MDDELLRAQDPDGGMGICLPLPDMPDPGEPAALKLHHMAVVVKDVERAVRLFKALGYVEEQTRVLWSKPDSATGLMFEILERRPEES